MVSILKSCTEILPLPKHVLYSVIYLLGDLSQGRSQGGGGSPVARAHPLEKKWLEGITGLKNDPQGRQVFLLAGTPLGKFLAMLLSWVGGAHPKIGWFHNKSMCFHSHYRQKINKSVFAFTIWLKSFLASCPSKTFNRPPEKRNIDKTIALLYFYLWSVTRN